ncbi:MAG: hypothetical protein P4N59_12610 [Negativicutes bacterium]|nr:hypothetical protein [Negativicutes bacterium]
MEDVMKMNGSEIADQKAWAGICKAELQDIAVMLGMFVGFSGLIMLVCGGLPLLP